MQVTVESTGTLERRMRVELPAERIEKEVDSRLKSVGKNVKIKGFRIETAEIESQLSAHGGVKEVVLMAREDTNGEKYLCAYYVPEQEEKLAGAASPLVEIPRSCCRRFPGRAIERHGRSGHQGWAIPVGCQRLFCHGCRPAIALCRRLVV